MTDIRLKHITADFDRHGNCRYYFRKRGEAKVRIHGLPGSASFMAAYAACLAGQPIPDFEAPKPADIIKLAPKTSFKWLCLQYMQNDHKFKNLYEDKTRSERIRILENICDQQIEEGKSLTIGEAPFEQMTTKVIRRIRDRKNDTPHEANNWLKGLKAVFGWALENQHLNNDPTLSIHKLKTSSQGHHTWTPEEIAAYEAKHPIGTEARLALALLRETGQRISDVIRFGDHLVKDGELSFTQHKNRKNKPVQVTIPIEPQLQKVLKESTLGAKTWLVNACGGHYQERNFGKKFRDWCDAAGLPHCTAHGLRKAGACVGAEKGATANQLMAVFGWRDIKQAELYTNASDRRQLARGAMKLIAS